MKRKWLAVGIILLFVGTSIIPAIAQNTEKQSPTSRGSWLYVGGSGSGNYTRIQDAINASSPGDTVFVFDKTYNEKITIQKEINLIGHDKETTIIQSNDEKATITITAKGLFLNNFTITNINGYGPGVFLREDSNNNRIVNNVIYGGLVLYKSYDNLISENLFVYAPFGIILEEESNNNIISNNTFDGNGLLVGYSENPLFTAFTKNNRIENNMVTRAYSDGITIDNAKNTTIYHNTIRFSETGCGLHISSSDSINISNNIVESNYDGLYVISSTNIIIAKNHFRTNGNQYSFGTLQLYNSRQNKIYSNNISKNKGYGLYLTFSRSEIINNNIIGNDYDAYFENTFFLRWQGNYWDEPHTFPKMIFGKISLFQEWNWYNFDWHPAQKPYDIEV